MSRILAIGIIAGTFAATTVGSVVIAVREHDARIRAQGAAQARIERDSAALVIFKDSLAQIGVQMDDAIDSAKAVINRITAPQRIISYVRDGKPDTVSVSMVTHVYHTDTITRLDTNFAIPMPVIGENMPVRDLVRYCTNVIMSCEGYRRMADSVMARQDSIIKNLGITVRAVKPGFFEKVKSTSKKLGLGAIIGGGIVCIFTCKS